ncbi:sugar ABC transporter ATP-binding protein [Histophilus somni]|uniref:Sugar ABC transporter ATP-binding protein n=1 Tax=Histophilus somni TaxID=731 RepID=A0A9Q6YZI7_HISSO|nr:sugar ABC transporter ATP-binding protein [Histophilus somni]ARU65012.1 sugar ABC transporter ATP-binding protein [Histophilus somni]ARU66878.1 sugar ABC transporter ATP-binding protein [Histophilus somni]ARU68749.1 sugar ABC transporter ATP-binding protein [Histophilus somni]ARU70631.1 sugar ABC transporter ATP-binding protein [Histophilus somni]ARU72504.1 sugar ABC transporter ATP-binding protein [Histophilus somni]
MLDTLPILSLRNISKNFYDVAVLDKINLDIYSGEVHCLIGENGAGKSTLCKIIAGIYNSDGGEMFFHGKIYSPRNVKDGQKYGVGFIHQELMLVPQLTVLENIFLGKEHANLGNRMDWKIMREKTLKIIRELELDIQPDDLVSDLSIAQQQMVEIAKAIFSEYKVLIFDEPTSSISRKNTETLFRIIHRLKEKGVAMIYISHRLEEFQYISDKVTVLRDGNITGTMLYKETSVEEIVRLMVGREINLGHYQRDTIFTQEKLCVENITNKKIKSASFTVHKGEILGFAGLVGAGRTELLRAIYGADDAKGNIFIDKLKVCIRSPEQAVKHKIGFITEDRKLQGLILDQSIRKNITLPILNRFWTGIRLDQEKEKNVAETQRDRLRIVSNSGEQHTRTLSGGNQQKVVIARWLESGVDILFFDEPTRGIDVGAKSEIYDLMREFTDNGGTIIMVSSDLPELITMSDRVMVMRNGEIVEEVKDRSRITEENLMKAMVGV